MIVLPNCRGFRVEIVPQLVDNAWDAGVRIRSPFANEVRRTVYLACRKPTAEEAEHTAEVWAWREVDQEGSGFRVVRTG